MFIGSVSDTFGAYHWWFSGEEVIIPSQRIRIFVRNKSIRTKMCDKNIRVIMRDKSFRLKLK